MMNILKVPFSRGSNGSLQNGSVSRLNDSSSGSSTVAISNGLSQPGPVTIRIYSTEKDGTSKERFNESETCEDICLSLAKGLGITPTMLNCFGLGVFDASLKKFYWLAPGQKPSEACCSMIQENEIFFRMRFLPKFSRCIQFDDDDPKCLEYFMCQVKWDFLHSNLPCFSDESKTDEARGFSCMLILLELRMNTEKTECVESLKAFMKKKDLDSFLPSSLRKRMLEKKILKDNMLKKVENLLEAHPASRSNSHFLMKWCLQVVLPKNHSYYSESFNAYGLEIDHEEFERIEGDDQPSQIVRSQELAISVTMDDAYPRLIVVPRNERRDSLINCTVENVSKLEIKSIRLDNDQWWQLHLFRQDGHPEMLYFKEKSEVYSFATCIESYSRLIYDFYESLCEELQPSFVRELNKIRAHGPIRDEFVKKKLIKKKSRDLYILRANLTEHGQYDVLYLPNVTARLRKKTLPKIKQVAEGYIVEGSKMQPQDIKTLMNDLIRDSNILPGICQRIKPQSEGCDLLQSLIMGQEPRDLQYEDDERRERKRLENQPKVYSRTDLVTQSLLGRGHFTEVYNGLLCEQDLVVVKRIRIKDIQDDDYRIVQEAFHDGLEKLMALSDFQYFIGYLGMTLTPNVSMIMKGTSYGSLQQFLQYREPGLPMLSLHHLLDVNIHIASALVYMEEKNCYHGNLHCGNIAVMNYDNRSMVVRICDPGLVSLYNKLPLLHDVNKRRLPWLAPELHDDLAKVTAQTEVYAYGTTLWQMFSQGLNPLDQDLKLRGKSPEQIISFFADGNVLSCPQFLHQKSEDADEIKSVKELLYRVMVLCWNLDPQERSDPKRILKELNNNAQSYEETYHKYNVIPAYDVESSAASLYPAASSSSGGTRQQSSGFMNSNETVMVPDLTCLKSDGRRNTAPPSNRNVTQTQSNNETQPTRSAMSTAELRPIGAQAAQSQPNVQVEQARGGAFGAGPSKHFTLPSSRPVVRYNIEERRLDIDWTAELGKGHYGAVYKGQLHPKDELKALDPQAGPETVVIKVLKAEMAERYSEDFKKEAQVMQKLNHPNVVKFYDIIHGGKYLVMEYVENNSLHKYVSKAGKDSIPQLTFLQLATDIARGMEYLESQRVIHCDLAARNVLLTRELHAKISDFGLSKILSQEKDYYRRSTDKTIPIFWCAPEWIGYKRFTSKSDVWSFGVVLWEMYRYGKPPFINNDRNVTKIMAVLEKGDRLAQPSNCPDEVFSEIKNCWMFDPSHRPDFNQLRIRFEQLYSELEAAGNSATHASSRPNSTTVQQNAAEERLTNGETEHNIKDQRMQASNANGQSPADTEKETQSGKVVKEIKVLNQSGRKDNKDSQTERKEHISKDTVQETSGAQGENQSYPTVGRSMSSNQSNPSPDSTGSKNLNQSNPSPDSTVNKSFDPTARRTTSSNQSNHSPDSTGSKNLNQSTNASQASSSRETKNGSENIIIDKKDLIYDHKDILGKGCFGMVFRGTYRGETVAVKMCTDQTEYSRFRREFQLLHSLRNKSSNIVRFIGIYECRDTGTGKEHMYVMEYLEGGSLCSYLIEQKRTGNTVDVPQKIKFMIDIAKGMECLFENAIVHGDLTAKNILLSEDLTAKISDFGWAKKLESQEDNITYERNDPRLQPQWAAPEVFSRHVYTKFSDTWSYGVVCLEIFQDGATPCLNIPLKDLKENGDAYLRKFFLAIQKGERFPRPLQCPEEIYKNVILKCWEKEYVDRILYKDVLENLLKYTTKEEEQCQ